MSDLVPKEAWDAVSSGPARNAKLHDYYKFPNTFDVLAVVAKSLEAAAPHIIAAELERLAKEIESPIPELDKSAANADRHDDGDEIRGTTYGLEDSATLLRSRASELREEVSS